MENDGERSLVGNRIPLLSGYGSLSISVKSLLCKEPVPSASSELHVSLVWGQDFTAPSDLIGVSLDTFLLGPSFDFVKFEERPQLSSAPLDISAPDSVSLQSSSEIRYVPLLFLFLLFLGLVERGEEGGEE